MRRFAANYVGYRNIVWESYESIHVAIYYVDRPCDAVIGAGRCLSG